MYDFVYRILFQDGEHRIVGEADLIAICEEQADQIVSIGRVEVHLADWREVTAATMLRITGSYREVRHGT